MPKRARIVFIGIVLLLGLVAGGTVVALLDPNSDPGAGPVSANDTQLAADRATSTPATAGTAGHQPSTQNAAAGYRPMPSQVAQSYSQVYTNTVDSVVMVRVITGQGEISTGSGFVYDSRGHIVTNEHVVRNADSVSVRFRGGSWRSATVVGTDVYTDLAVIAVSNVPSFADPLPIAGRNPRPGQPVAALGSPFGLEGSISSGIVSGINRSMPTGEGFAIPATVQTDAPINPGNSGGPLVSLHGTVVGVNRAKEGDNVGYAISPLVISRVVPALIEQGTYEHAYVGIRTIPVTPSVATANGLANTTGVLVVGVLENGPAQGDLQPSHSRTVVNKQVAPVGGDIIIAIDGHRLLSQEHLARYLMLHTRPGEQIHVTVLREGRRVTETMTLADRPAPSRIR